MPEKGEQRPRKPREAFEFDPAEIARLPAERQRELGFDPKLINQNPANVVRFYGHHFRTSVWGPEGKVVTGYHPAQELAKSMSVYASRLSKLEEAGFDPLNPADWAYARKSGALKKLGLPDAPLHLFAPELTMALQPPAPGVPFSSLSFHDAVRGWLSHAKKQGHRLLGLQLATKGNQTSFSAKLRHAGGFTIEHLAELSSSTESGASSVHERAAHSIQEQGRGLFEQHGLAVETRQHLLTAKAKTIPRESVDLKRLSRELSSIISSHLHEAHRPSFSLAVESVGSDIVLRTSLAEKGEAPLVLAARAPAGTTASAQSIKDALLAHVEKALPAGLVFSAIEPHRFVIKRQ